LNEHVRHHVTGDDEPDGLYPGRPGGWPLPDGYDSLTSDDLAPGDLWDGEGPGSAAAIARGCRCPMLPNHPRAGLGLLIAPDCPVHRSRLD
jgi:hypothetical protein